MKKASTGQLASREPADEPASTLLARIRAEQDTTQSTRRGRRTSAVL